MSHSSGEVFDQDDNRIGYFEYDGTADIGYVEIRASFDEVTANWRQPTWRECECGSSANIVPVRMHAHYGGGIDWDSEACLSCMTVIGNTDPYAEPTSKRST